MLCTMAAQILSNSSARVVRGTSKAVSLTLPWDEGPSAASGRPDHLRDSQPDHRGSSVAEIPVATGDTLFPVPGQRSSSPEELMSSHREAQEQPTSPPPPAEHRCREESRSLLPSLHSLLLQGCPGTLPSRAGRAKRTS